MAESELERGFVVGDPGSGTTGRKNSKYGKKMVGFFHDKTGLHDDVQIELNLTRLSQLAPITKQWQESERKCGHEETRLSYRALIPK